MRGAFVDFWPATITMLCGLYGVAATSGRSIRHSDGSAELSAPLVGTLHYSHSPDGPCGTWSSWQLQVIFPWSVVKSLPHHALTQSIFGTQIWGYVYALLLRFHFIIISPHLMWVCILDDPDLAIWHISSASQLWDCRSDKQVQRVC